MSADKVNQRFQIHLKKFRKTDYEKISYACMSSSLRSLSIINKCLIKRSSTFKSLDWKAVPS